MTGEKLLTLKAHSAFVKAIVWSPDGRLLASGGNEKTIHLWDITSGKLLSRYEGHNGSVHAIVWSVDGKRLASGGLDQSVLMWEPTSGTLLERMAGFVRVVAGSSDGRQSAVGGSG